MSSSDSCLEISSASHCIPEGGNDGNVDDGESKATAVALALAQQESVEHMEGMAELYEAMRKRPLVVRAYPLSKDEVNDKNETTNVKTLHLIRHGQGFHNLLADLAHEQGRTWKQFVSSPENPYTMIEVLDCPLTERGRIQAMRLQASIQKFSTPPELVVSSPHCRALQTALLAFGHLLDHPSKCGDPNCGKLQPAAASFVAHEFLREQTGVHVCDQRRPTSSQALEFPHFDFALLSTEHDVLFQKDQRETKEQLGERIYQFLEWLESRPEKHVGICSHSVWLLTLLNGVCECTDDRAKDWFQTGEMRSIKLQFFKS